MSHTTTNNGGQRSFDDALDRMIDNSVGGGPVAEAAAAAVVDRPEFIPSKTWQGSKPGYYFGTCQPHGTGYHWDHVVMHPTRRATTSSTDEAEDSSSRKRKRKEVRIMEEKNQVVVLMTGEELLKQAEDLAGDSKVLELTTRGVQQAVSALDRAMRKNALKRAQHADAPENYMESELALHESITSLKSVAADPTLYPNLLPEALELFSNLLSHDNSDVALSVINVLVEWLDPTLLVENETAQQHIAAVAKSALEQCLEMAVANLGRLNTDEPEDVAGIEDTLTWMESLLELDMSLNFMGETTSVAREVLKETTFLSWLLPQATTANSKVQGHAAELLAFLLQHEDAPACVTDLGQLPPYQSAFTDEQNSDSKKSSTIDGMELLLQAIAVWRKRHPSTEAECECLENFCLALASSLFQPQNVKRFLEAQGIELVLRCVREKVHAGGAALKTLDFSYGSDPVYREACERLVDVGGLKHIFPLLMGRSIPKPAPCSDAGKHSGNNHKTSKRIQHARREWAHSLETNAIQIVYALTRHLSDASPHDAKERLLVKFLEADCEKCDRLVELLLQYDERARMAEYNFYRSEVEEEMEDDNVELAALNAKLKGGGDLFHRVSAIAAFCCVGSKRCHEHILAQLTLQNSGIGLIKAALEEFASVLGDGDQKEQLQNYLTQI